MQIAIRHRQVESSVLSAHILRTEQKPRCRKEDASRQSVPSKRDSPWHLNGFRLSRLSTLSRQRSGTPFRKKRAALYTLILFLVT